MTFTAISDIAFFFSVLQLLSRHTTHLSGFNRAGYWCEKRGHRTKETVSAIPDLSTHLVKLLETNDIFSYRHIHLIRRRPMPCIERAGSHR